ncbi:Asp/Glu/hydantoin racemase [Burkholderia multivorans]|uniref:maleate cis-trans isomerase family protein n=1 Tax=Burkholderia multivorans TaxID=87883 RepID=UPI0019AD89BA|nr:Asp/Glu racemase [Burkholderia multivorans]CAB5285471.1 Asp/Glu/hydantoin racemase [Burkholderia multivorans]CAB5293713.1 Asp/Glu/hydantoin racemase [Burkholderia multivorans]CAB5302383.1 Asp/Glu/hydantoin racemase [Burkholderia multivorans]CAB5302560.1 Asp/Glu/hydantoin racemase [Burkholderia multivorans]CAB5303531.1 Asp/Glu/hydantoin racemase [Burkholderia multivorans]
MKTYRIGQIVPSSNTTMETEIPAMLNARRPLFPGEPFTFHSARMRMMHVTPEELKKMDVQSDRCAQELSDARCDVLAYACLVAIMCQGPGYHQQSELRLGRVTEENGAPTPVVSSAGALCEGIKAMGFGKVAILTPYMKPLTQQVADYIENEDIEVTDALSLEVSDNLEVGRLNPMNLLEHVKRLDISGADAVVLSACVQMPSLPAVQAVEDRLGKPVLTASIATVYRILKTLGLAAQVPDAGHLLSGRF